MKPRRLTQAGEHGTLIILVGDSKPALESHVVPVCPQQFGAEGVNRPALHQLDAGIEVIQPPADFFGRLVGERKGVDAAWFHSELLNQEPDSFDEAKRLARARASEHEDRSGRRLYGRQLRRRWAERIDCHSFTDEFPWILLRWDHAMRRTRNLETRSPICCVNKASGMVTAA